MLTVDKVSLQFGGRALFRDLGFTVRPKDRVAFVGPNGAGKSTLMKIIAGIETPDSGGILKAKGLGVGYLPQEGIHISGTTLFAEVEQAFGGVLAIQAELDKTSELLDVLDTSSEEFGEALERFGALQLRLEHHDVAKMKPRIETVLSGLGFARTDFGRDTGEFSGGWQMRIALAKLLLAEPDVLLLDEPTNHLDLDSQQWVEGFLVSYAGAIVLISHDRAFLDSLVDRTLAFEKGRVEEYAGNYSFYVREREARRELLVRAYKNQQREIEKTEALINRFRAKASKAAMAQSRIKALDKMERIEIEAEDAEISFRFPQPRPSGQSVVKMEGLTKRYGSLTVFENFDFEITKCDRIAVVGVNGAGKSTFTRIASGQEAPSEGTRTVGYKVSIAHFSQNHADELDCSKTVLRTVEEAASRQAAPHARTLLGSFLFRGDDVFKTVGVLSGGERSRVALARMLVQPANFLLLDEPTNHLDMQSQEVLQHALKEYTGTYLIVSHNRAFLDPVVTKVLEFAPGQQPRLFLGNVTDYIEKKQAEAEAASRRGAPPAAARTDLAPASGTARKEQKKAEARLRQERSQKLKPLEQELETVEATIANLEREKAEIVRSMSVPEFFEDKERAKGIAARFKEVDLELESAYTRWTKIDEELDRQRAKLQAPA
ncbi:ABC-F family ATP-binding cassette domain-containing protein [soil metagenome]